MVEHVYGDQPVLTPGQVAAKYHVKRAMLLGWLETGCVPYVKIDGLIRFPEKEIEVFFRWHYDGDLPTEAPAERPDHIEIISDAPPPQLVYFIQQDGGGLIKIGWTTGLIKTRLAGLSGGSPVTLRLLGTIPGGNDLERRLHRHFAEERRHGEWFSPSDRLLTFIKETLARDG